MRTPSQCVRLQDKPLRLLLALVENAQLVVTRDHLRDLMWESGTLVDYEQGINAAIKKVRDALGDSADEPRFIQTVAKRGYRFLLPVEVVRPEVAASSRPAPATSSHLLAKAAVSRSGPILRHRVWPLVTLGILAVLGSWFSVARAQHRHAREIHSLAVLPLRNLSLDPGQEYFAEGVTEDLITNLGQTLPLRVISRTSVMRYKDTSEPITQIARDLGVDAVVEGAVTRAGNRVSVTVQLINATEDRHLWAHRYDRDIGSLLEIESQVSEEISSQVAGTIGHAREQTTATSQHVDPQVYDLYLMGRYHWNRRTAAGLKKAAEYFQQVISRDPAYAPAYAGMANVYAILPHYDDVDVNDSQTKALDAARHALELEDSLAEAHATLGLLEVLNGQISQSQSEFQRALQLNPNDSTAHHWFAYYLLFSNRQDEALAEMESARQLDPLSGIVNADEGQFLYGARRYQEARVRLETAAELEPDLGQPHETLALIDLAEGHESEALKESRSGLRLDPHNPRTLGVAGYVFAKTGQRAEARKLLAELTAELRHGSGFPTYVASIYLGLGERDKAIETLEAMASGKAPGELSGLAQLSIFDELSRDPRYQKLLSQAKQMSN